MCRFGLLADEHYNHIREMEMSVSRSAVAIRQSQLYRHGGNKCD